MKISKSKGFDSLSNCTDLGGSAVGNVRNSMPVRAVNRSHPRPISQIVVGPRARRDSDRRADAVREFLLWRSTKGFQDPPVGSQASP